MKHMFTRVAFIVITAIVIDSIDSVKIRKLYRQKHWAEKITETRRKTRTTGKNVKDDRLNMKPLQSSIGIFNLCHYEKWKTEQNTTDEMVSINSFCTGTLVKTNYVLTAAQCLNELLLKCEAVSGHPSKTALSSNSLKPLRITDPTKSDHCRQNMKPKQPQQKPKEKREAGTVLDSYTDWDGSIPVTHARYPSCFDSADPLQYPQCNFAILKLGTAVPQEFVHELSKESKYHDEECWVGGYGSRLSPEIDGRKEPSLYTHSHECVKNACTKDKLPVMECDSASQNCVCNSAYYQPVPGQPNTCRARENLNDRCKFHGLRAAITSRPHNRKGTTVLGDGTVVADAIDNRKASWAGLSGSDLGSALFCEVKNSNIWVIVGVYVGEALSDGGLTKLDTPAFQLQEKKNPLNRALFAAAISTKWPPGRFVGMVHHHDVLHGWMTEMENSGAEELAEKDVPTIPLLFHPQLDDLTVED